METDRSPLDRASAILGMQSVQAAALVDQWNATAQSNVIRTLVIVQIEDKIQEITRQFQRCKPDEVSLLQGKWIGLDMAKAIIAGKLT